MHGFIISGRGVIIIITIVPESTGRLTVVIKIGATMDSKLLR